MLALATALGIIAGAGGLMLAGGAGTDSQIDARIRTYLLEHPEILPEAMKRLEARNSAQAVAQQRAALQTPFAGAWAGAARGDVTVVMFTDYSCGYCRASVADIDRLLAEDKGVKLVWREIPILGPRSDAAARIALAAARQPGRYLAVHHELFAGRSEIVAPPEDPEITQEIEKNLALARGLGVTGTPTFVVGDQLLQGAVGYEKLRQAVAEARKAG